MIRALHRWPGLLVLVLITVSALSGAALSIFPTMERLAVSRADAGLTVVELASRIQIAFTGVEQIRRAPSGRITAYRFEGGVPGAAIIDPSTGQSVDKYGIPVSGVTDFPEQAIFTEWQQSDFAIGKPL